MNEWDTLTPAQQAAAAAKAAWAYKGKYQSRPHARQINTDTAPDIISEIWLIMTEDTPPGPLHLALAIAASRAAQRVNKKHPQEVNPQEATPPGAVQGPEAWTIAAETIRRAANTPELLQIARLRADGYTIKQTAEALLLSPSAVQRRIETIRANYKRQNG